METLANVHPGEILLEEFLKPMNITAYKLSKDIGIPQTRTSAILKGVRGITADTALRLSLYFGTSPKFWLGLQEASLADQGAVFLAPLTRDQFLRFSP